MSETLEGLAQDIRTALKSAPGIEGRKKVGERLSSALVDEAFITQHLRARAPGEHPRKVLFEDPELGFCICGHVYDGPAAGKPHDHGPAWAIYGQAAGETEMTEWKIVEKGDGNQPSLVEPVRTYTMKPGDTQLYDVGDVHSPNRAAPVKLIRIEGANLDRVTRSKIEAK